MDRARATDQSSHWWQVAYEGKARNRAFVGEDIGRCRTSTAEPRHNMGRTKHRQIQASKGPPVSQPLLTRQKSRSRTMAQFKIVYWCISHQQYVAPKARTKLRDQLRCKTVKLNLTLLRQVDLQVLSTWVQSRHSLRNRAMQNRES